MLVFYAWLIFASTQAHLPSNENPLILYSNQTRQDIKYVLCQALKKSTLSIFLSVYGISDPQVIALLGKKTDEKIPIRIEYDPSASANLKKALPHTIELNPRKSKGLMHRKIATIDHSQVFLGSANLTTTSLRHHANLILGLYSPELAAFLEQPNGTSFSFHIADQQGDFFLLPDSKRLCFKRLIEEIGKAHQKIVIAMFTLTHPAIANALIQAKQRGIDVFIVVDYYTAKGASKKTLAAMAKEGVNIQLSQGRELLHHKWAVIDDAVLVMGSANWTKAAFSKNSDFLLFLSPLQSGQLQFFKNLWGIIESEAVQYNPQS